MKRTLLIVWLLLPVVVVIWHFGPGQFHLGLDRAGLHLRSAERAAAKEDWLAMAASYAKAQEALPAAAADQRYRLALAEAQARIHGGQMAAGQDQLKKLLIELKDDTEVDYDLKTHMRSALATSSYYEAWRMRVAGAPHAEWIPAAERARELFRWLTEDSAHRAASDTDVGGTAAHRQARAFAKNLEATIKLQQMDVEQLSERPWPKDCPDYFHKSVPKPRTPVALSNDSSARVTRQAADDMLH